MRHAWSWLALTLLLGCPTARNPTDAGSTRCNPTNCSGCCTADGQCRSGAEQAACGLSGSACQNCGFVSCQFGRCIAGGGGGGFPTGGGGSPTGGGGGGGGTTFCGPGNCATCCTGPFEGFCATPSPTLCGSGGARCLDCAVVSAICDATGTSCVAPDGGCGGCVDDAGTCVSPFTSRALNAQCGLSGVACVACGYAQVCSNGICVPNPLDDGRVRLVMGDGGPNGRLEARDDIFPGSWGQVCDDNFDLNDNGPNVVCRELGFTSGTQSNATGPSSVFLLDDVTCDGGEATLQDCAHAPFGVENCAAADAVFITCQ
ncbi:MAG: scavenger receptor cysteine-rich domain-containing protein [Myxococcaceae bacterium]